MNMMKVLQNLYTNIESCVEVNFINTYFLIDITLVIDIT